MLHESSSSVLLHVNLNVYLKNHIWGCFRSPLASTLDAQILHVAARCPNGLFFLEVIFHWPLRNPHMAHMDPYGRSSRLPGVLH